MKFQDWLRNLNKELKLSDPSIEAVLTLSSEGATIPFMARYRKEKTGNLDEVEIQKILEGFEKYNEILKRKEFILGEIEKQKKLTPELKKTIELCFDADKIEDLYLPYKIKKKTKATVAKEAGLEPLALWILTKGQGASSAEHAETLEKFAATFVSAEKKVLDAAQAIAGAQDIVIEKISETLELRDFVRAELKSSGILQSKKSEKAKVPSKFENYFDFKEDVMSLQLPKNSHRYLALRRGWVEEEITLVFSGKPDAEAFERRLLNKFEAAYAPKATPDVKPLLEKCAKLSLKAVVLPSIENEIHKHLKEIADQAAISVFSENVKNLLLSAPFGSKSVLGVDPGIRSGCKLVLIDDSGKYLTHWVFYLNSPGEIEKSKDFIAKLLSQVKVAALAVGNGTAGRETEAFLRACVKEVGMSVPVVRVNESGASIYSASEIARQEFPDLDLTVRGAISIARRFQDPLAELVKVDAKSIGVGQYQHDVSQPALKKSLDFVVDACVNQVGVNLNTASEPLLSHVSGIGPGLAKAIVEFRVSKGLFKKREQLLEVPRFSRKVYEQAAGFLRIPDAANPLDNTGVHPERYEVLEKHALKSGLKIQEILGSGASKLRQIPGLKEELGAFTFEDILKEIEKPGRDPRESFVPFAFRDDIHEIKDLKEGMQCPGVVTNVTNFGAFVDIGVHQDGLVHLSQLADRFIKDPHEVVKPGDSVNVRVLAVDLAKKQISLSMKSVDAAAGRSAPRENSAPNLARNHAPNNAPNNSPRHAPAKPSPNRPQFSGASRDRPHQQTAPQTYQSKAPAAQSLKIDPNSPFAKLAAIRDTLGKAKVK